MEKPKVLVADNSLFMRTMLKSQLESQGFSIVGVAKDRQEFGKYLELKPDVALIDIAIAETDDFWLVREVRERYHAGVIVMIPDQPGLPEVVVEAVRAGAGGYIKKPISPGDLKLRMKGVLGR